MRRERERDLSPEIERDLEAIDRALAGESVDAELAELATLATELRAERPEPDESFAWELDRRVEAGFARPAAGRAARAAARARARLASVHPARALVPAGGVATVIVAVAVGISVIGDGRPGPADGEVGVVPDEPAVTAEGAEGAESLGRDLRQRSDDPLSLAGPDMPRAQLPEGLPPRRGPIAPRIDPRREQREALITLSAGPEEVREISDDVIRITRGLDGVVVRSQIRSGEQGASAFLELMLPTRNLDQAVERITELANVESMSEAALDITTPFVSARDRLRDARAERRELLEALGNAQTEAEAEALRRQLAAARRAIARTEARFERIARRARFAELTVNVTGDPNASASNGWTLSDAVDDALSVLRTTAGIMLVTAAVVVPIGLLIALIWLASARIRRTRRERGLDSAE